MQTGIPCSLVERQLQKLEKNNLQDKKTWANSLSMQNIQYPVLI